MKWQLTPRTKKDLFEQLLFNRNIKTETEKAQFFHPKISDYADVLMIPEIEKTISRIKQAIEKNEQICIYADYDVDGVCAAAILYKGLTSVGAKAIPYIPHRDKEGYGISNSGLDFIKNSGATLVITVDNGIVAINQAKYAKELGLDLVITDHHLPAKELPEAFSIVHSTKMCGSAVAWCLIKDIIKKELADDLLQFVALATVCDLIPLIGLNRAFVYEGLKILNKTNNPGLLSLIDQSGATLGKIDAYAIGHILGPRINAIGRLEHAIEALRLLCTKDQAKARSLARLLCQTNEQRQKLTIKAVDEARLQVNKLNKIHILASEEWQSGIIGLIAGRITEEFVRPTIAISINGEFAKGSARSIEGINIVELIRTHSELLIDIGGHPGAAGFSIQTKNIAVFKQELEKLMIDLPEEVEKVLKIEAELRAQELTKNLVHELNKFEPMGFGNPKPIFACYQMQLSNIRTVGNGKHLKLKADGIDVIGFGLGETTSKLKDGISANLAFYVGIDDFTGTEKLQLILKDIKV